MIRYYDNRPNRDEGIFLYYKPSCIISRRLRDFLVKKGITFRERNIEKFPLREQDLKKLMLGHSAEEFVSKKSLKYKELNLGNKYMTGEAMLKLIAQEPTLLKKPILVKGEEIIIGYTRKRMEPLLTA